MSTSGTTESCAGQVQQSSYNPPIWIGCLVVSALLMLARPYSGLRHDGILYLGQALLQMWPEVFSKDIFFEHGSQDAFSIVSHLLAWLYMAAGIDVVHLLLPLFSQLALLAIAWRVMVGLSPFERWLGLAMVATASHLYGGLSIFAFGERYLTGRTFAEPIALAALAFIQSRYRVLALPALFLAGAFHPLVALPAAVVAWTLLVLDNKRWAWAALFGLVPLVSAAAGLKPFDNLFRSFDEAWFTPVSQGSPHLFLSNWRRGDWQLVVFDLASLIAATRLLPMPFSRLAKAVLISTAALLALSFAAIDFAHNVLITQLQPWRVLWITHLLGLITIPALVIHWWSQGQIGRLVAAAFVLAAAAVNAGWQENWIFIGWWAGTVALMHRRVTLSAAMLRLALFASAIAAVGLSTMAAVKLARFAADGAPGLSMAHIWLMAAATTPVLSVGIAARLLSFDLRDRWRIGAVALVGFLMLALGALHWDHRSAWSKYVEGALHKTHPFAARISPDSQVYWHKELAATWAVLRRASYFSDAQEAGIVFNRGTAIDFASRQKAFAKLRLQESICEVVDSLESIGDKDAPPCDPSKDVVAEICQSELRLRYLVFKFPLDGAVIDQWIFHAKVGNPTTYYLHDCLHLR